MRSVVRRCGRITKTDGEAGCYESLKIGNQDILKTKLFYTRHARSDASEFEQWDFPLPLIANRLIRINLA